MVVDAQDVVYGLHRWQINLCTSMLLVLVSGDSPCAGASAGSLTTCLFLSGLTANEMMEGAIELSENCRKDGTMGRLRSVLEGVLRNVVPQDAHMRCSGKPSHPWFHSCFPTFRFPTIKLSCKWQKWVL